MLESWLTDASQITSTIIAGYNNGVIGYCSVYSLREKTQKDVHLHTKHDRQRSLVRHLCLQFAVAGGIWRTDLWVIGGFKSASMLPSKMTITRKI